MRRGHVEGHVPQGDPIHYAMEERPKVKVKCTGRGAYVVRGYACGVNVRETSYVLACIYKKNVNKLEERMQLVDNTSLRSVMCITT